MAELLCPMAGPLQSPVDRPDLGNLGSSHFASPPDTLNTDPEFESSLGNFAGILSKRWGFFQKTSKFFIEIRITGVSASKKTMTPD